MYVKTKYPMNIGLYLSILLLFVTLFSACFAPRYKWEYLLPDHEEPSIIIGGYEVIVSMVAYKENQEENQEGYINFSLFFETFYQDPIPADSFKESVPLIIIDSVSVYRPTYKYASKQKMTCEDSSRLSYWSKQWEGPSFGTGVKVHQRDEVIQVDFNAIVKNRITMDIIIKKHFKIELIRFYDRYWIMMQ